MPAMKKHAWRDARLATKIGVLGAALLLAALASIGATLWISWQLVGGAAAVNEAGRLRMQTWELTHVSARGEQAQAEQLRARIDASLALLARGEPARPLFLPRDADTQTQLQAVERAWREARGHVINDREARALVAQIDALVSRVEERIAGWTAILSSLQLALLPLAIVGCVGLLVASRVLVFLPVDRLRNALRALENGDLSARVPVRNRDELGEVADGFNAMAERLGAAYRGMELQVRDRTADLRAEQQRLTLLYEASAFAAQVESTDALAAGFADRLRRAARSDAVIIRCLDPRRERMVLLASQGLPPGMMDAERCLAKGDCHCGAPEPVARVIRIEPATDYGTHCQKAGFCAVISVALRLHGETVGEIDLLYRDTPQLLPADRVLLDSLAAHLSTTIERLRAAALQREAAIAEERAMLARELHDSIAQGLAFTKIQVQLLRQAQLAGCDEEAAKLLDEVELGIKESTADVRALLLHFRTRTDGDDLVPALQQTLHKFRLQSGLEAELEVRGHGAPLPADHQVQLLHVVQEALSNVRKHAGARGVKLVVEQQPQFSIEVQDDGRGFDTEGEGPDDSHVGLRIMRERAERVGAVVDIQSQPGSGTRVRVALPQALALSA
jgi:two-component system nitrate/nitrite sensor histidine kinase NarX